MKYYSSSHHIKEIEIIELINHFRKYFWKISTSKVKAKFQILKYLAGCTFCSFYLSIFKL